MLRQDNIGPIPNGTRRVAEAAFPDGNRYVRLGDELGTLFTDALFSNLYPERGQPALPPWRLALVTLLQFAEGLSDRQAAAAVRSRIDWKYLLRLELTDPGFDYSVLSEFRTRLLLHGADYLIFDHLISCCRERGLVIAGGRQRTDSTHILAAVRALNRIEVVGETLRFALNRLAVVAPAWLEVKFSSTDCRHCPHLTQCVRSKKPYPRRTLSIWREQLHKALVAARQRERTRAFKHEYRRRAGIEGTLSRSLRVTRLRRTRYIGLDRVRLGQILTGLGVNALRLGEWFLGLERPKSRVTPFMRLMAGATAA